MVTMTIACGETCLHRLFEAQAARTPDAPALAFEDQKLSYRELDRRANQLARQLWQMGLGRDMPVGLCVERSLDMVVGILGVLKAGAAYLPIDPAYPPERIAFMLEDARTGVLLSQAELADGLPAGPAQLVTLDEIDWYGEDAGPPAAVAAHDLAYVIYTSGSTGRPKGVCIEHRSIVAYVEDICERLRFAPGMHHATVSTIAADLGNTVIFPALASGGCLHVVSQERAQNQGMLAEYFLRERIDVLKIVPSHLAALQGARNPEHVMPAQRLILGGEASRLDWIARLRRLAPQCEIHNHYGPTETTVGVLTYRVDGELPATPSGRLPLGAPLARARLYILDEHGQRVADGEIGELHIGGAGVARGYLNRPDLTAEKFIPDPFGDDRGARLYRSGDLARRLPDGNYEFCGRIDDQVKRHGYRVELGEIEAALRGHPGVRDAVVLAREDARGDVQLAAYVVPQRAQQPLWRWEDLHVLPDGAPVAHLNRSETDYIYHEIFVLQAYLRHGIRIEDGDCVVDAGANIGLFTVFANRVARDLRMLAFEPNPAAYACLKANADAWGTAVKCLPHGLSDAECTAELTFFEGMSLLSGFYADAATERGVVRNYVANQQAIDDVAFDAEIGALIDERMRSRTVSAQLRRLSSVIAEEGLARIDLLKINVEKSELDVLRGIDAADWAKIRQLAIEVDRDSNLEAITALLGERGYDVIVDQDPLLRDTQLRYVYAARPGEGRLKRQDGAESHARPVPAAAPEVLSQPTLRRYLAARLPAYMMPTAVTLLDSLPLNANGKLDRQALPAIVPDAAPALTGHVEPRTETEAVLAAVWGELLKVDNVGVHDDFFDLGGQSLLAIQAVSRIRDLFGVDMPAHVLFENASIAQLARVMAETRAAGSEVRRIGRRRQEGACALSFSQEQQWFLHQMAPDSPAYNIVDVVELPGSYAAGALDQALRELMQRHEVLRAAFSLVGGRPMQNILPALVPPLREEDLGALPESQRAERWQAIAREEGRKPFDLAVPPLLRGTVVHFSPTEHRLLFCIHHIVADEWSMELIQRELRQLYEAFGRGKPSPLPELPLQYLDFAHWQREQLHAEALRKQTAWWTAELAGAPQTLELQTDKPRPAVQSHAGACVAFALPRRLRERAMELGKQEKATLFMVLEASFAALLQRYTGQDDLLVGTPISGRTWSETEGLIGAFLNTVVLRARFAERMSFRELLQQTRAHALGAYAHADLPFERLVAALATQRDAGRTPLFQAMFILHNAGGLSRVAQVGRALELETGTAKFDLTLFVSETADGLDCLIEYGSDLFEAATMRRLAGHYANLLEAAVAEPDASLSHLAMLGADELRELLVERNATAADFPPRCVHELIAEQAHRTPGRIAATCGDERLTYAELERRAGALARRLLRAGLRPDAPVGLLVERSLDMLTGVLGILKAGGAYVPLDPAYPADRLAYMAEDSGMEMLVTHRGLERLLNRPPRSVVRLDEEDAADASLPVPPAPATPDGLAYILYTSGSTGKPKGVAIGHAALANFLQSMRRAPGIADDDVLLAITTLSFDIAGLELYLPLMAGASVAVASRDEALDPALLAARIERSGCTLMQATPTTWRALLNAGWPGAPRLRALCGGEALPVDLAQALLPRCAELWNMYGPTETTVWSTLCRITEDDVAAGLMPIGRPIANTGVFVLDAGRNPVPSGLVGELYIGGKGLARGYWRREELTRERFVRSPFAPDAPIYRTGDLARWLPDGRLLCLGRSDNQLKVRGFRIEAGEVEAAILAHPAVREAVVAACDGGSGELRLAAYFVAAADAPADLEERLRAQLRSSLPDYMVPSYLIALPALPRTGNGKLDRKALPAPRAAAQPRAAATAPRTPTEARVLAMFQEAVGRQDFGILDNFFDCGGHSLMAARLMAALREAYGLAMPLRNLFERPTAAGLAEIIDELSWLASGQARTAAAEAREEFEL